MHILWLFAVLCVYAYALPDPSQNHVVVVQLAPSVERDVPSMASQHGFQYYGPIPGLPSFHVFHRSNTQQYVPHALESNEHVLWWEEQVPRQRFTRINMQAVKNSVVGYRKNPKRVDVEGGRVRKQPVQIRPVAEEEEEARYTDDGPSGPQHMNTHGSSHGHTEELGTDVLPFDPMVVNGDQWHLVNPRDLPGTDSSSLNYIGSPININVLNAWENGFAGQGVIVGVVDDGLQWRHPDLFPNYADTTSYDVNNDDTDPTPLSRNTHGTAAGGLAVAAANNNECGVGVAYRARISGIKLLERASSDSHEAMALAYRCTCPVSASNDCLQNRVYSSSWGPMDSGRHLDGPGHITREALQHCNEHGSGGLGSIYVWAGGNGRRNLDNSNYDGYANSRLTIAVTAVEDYGDFAPYSEPGANILISSPSSGARTARKIGTVDLMGRDGVSATNCRTDFGGTSAAAPIVAGGIATILSANPGLTPRDVEHILVRTANRGLLRREVNPWVQNAAGFFHSDDFGFGLLDVSAAVNMARRWTPVKRLAHVSSDDMSLEGITISAGTMIELHWNATINTQIFYLEHVQMTLEAHTPNGHGWVGVQLCSPTGTCSILQDANPGRDTSITWTYDTVKHWGEDIIDRVGQRAADRRQPMTFSRNMNRGTLNSGYVPINMWYARVANMCNARSDDVVLHSWRLDFWGYTMGSREK